MNLNESMGTCRKKLTAALCGMLVIFTASAFGQREISAPRLEGPLSPLLLAFDASKLKGDARRTFDVLALIIEDVDQTNTANGRKEYLREFLARSQEFSREHPDSLQLWTLRAAAALEANQPDEGREACKRMIGLKSGDTNDPRIRRVLAMLDRKGWFNAKQSDSMPVAPSLTSAAKTSAPKRESNPLAGFEKTKDGNYDFGSNVGTRPDIAKPMPEKLEGAKDAPLVEGAQSTLPAIDRNKPRARPVLDQPHTRPAVYSDNPMGTSNIGPVAYSSKWSKYGEYLHKMMEAIQIQWDRILLDSRAEPPSGTHVVVKFTMDLHGKITDIAEVKTTSNDQGKQSCLTAITMTAPYGDWSDDMIAVLGTSQELTFDFYFQ